jgi:hypothetical protein
MPHPKTQNKPSLGTQLGYGITQTDSQLLQMLLFKYFARNFNAQKMDTRTHEQLDS